MAQAAVTKLQALPTTGLSAALHDQIVGFALGFSAPGRRVMKARQALGFALEVQVQRVE
jgi:hypothetical protein